MRTLRILAASLAVALVSVFAAPSAEALSITLTDGTVFVTVSDGGPGDANAIPGIVSFNESVGDFQIVFTAGLSDPITGSSSNPALVFNLEAFSLTGGTLTAILSDNNFAGTDTGVKAGLFSPSPLNLIGLPLATTSTIYATYFSATNAEFAFDTLLTFQNTPGFANGSLPSAVGPYSLSQVIQITSGPGVSTASATLTVPVPDGGLALSLLGFALVGVEGLRRRFNGR